MADANQEAAVLQTCSIHGHHANISPDRETPIRGKTSTLRHKLVKGAYRFQVPKCHAVRGMEASHAPHGDNQRAAACFFPAAPGIFPAHGKSGEE